jgi:thioester reductase-like protein
LNLSDPQRLLDQITASATFSEAELQLLPRLLAALTQPSPDLDWLYETQWREQPLSAIAPSPAEHWLILADRLGVGEAIAQQLSDRGCTYSLLYCDQAIELPASVDRVLHLWSLELETLTLRAIEQSQTLLTQLLMLLPRLRQLAKPPKLWLVTRGAVGTQVTNPAAAALWGLGQGIAIEHPELWGGLIDFDAATSIDQLLSSVMAANEDQVLLQANQRFVARLVPKPRSTPQSLTLHADANYLITGGLGALGLQVARSLIAQGARSLVLLSRRKPTAAAEREIAELAETAKILVLQADVANLADMAHVVQSIPNLRGVVHAAGTTNFRPLAELTAEDLQTVLRPKVLGGWILHQLTRSRQIDFFVNFSSIVAVIGSKGQAHYAAANQFLDSLAHYRRGLGLPALSINWSFWAGEGMGSEELKTTALHQLGLAALPQTQAIATFEQLLRSDSPQTTVAQVDWSKFRSFYSRSLLAELGEAPVNADSHLLQQVKAAAPNQRYGILVQAIQTEVAKALSLSDLPSPDRNVFDLGMDSLAAIVLVNYLRSQLQTDLPIADFMQADSLGAIAAILVRPFAESEVSVVQTAVDLNAEAVLDPAIVPGVVELNEVSAILLTGATGYLGAFLLRELLAQTSADIYCLVRASSIRAGMHRIQNNLETYKLWQNDLGDRIIPLCGDLAQPLLGLSQDQFDRLAHQIDVVYHNGAVLNFVYPYSALKAPNVLGTQEILRFACQSKTKPLHYVSTDGVFDSSGWYDQEVTEATAIVHTAGIDLGYTQTKWVAERLVTIARDRGLPVTIYRPPLIAGDSRTGVWFTDDFICRFIKGCIQLGSMPIMSNRLTMSPVDYVSQAIVHLSQQPSSIGQAFHLNNPHPATWTSFVESINALGYPVRTVSFEDWMAQLVTSVSQSPDNALSELVPFFARRWSAEQLTFAELGQRRVKLNCQQTVQHLMGSGVDCVPVNAQLLSTYFAYFIATGFLSAPKVQVV